jgi:hypothetical protein
MRPIYRAQVRVDAACERRYLTAGAAERLEVVAWPGGTLPALDAGLPPLRLESPLAVELAVEDAAGTAVARRTLAVADRRTVLALDLPALAPGGYRARLAWRSPTGAALERVWTLTAAVPSAANPDTGELVPGAAVVDLDCAATDPVGSSSSAVTERAGARVRETQGRSRDERLAWELALPAGQADGRPWLLEVQWPDDQPRTFGIYLYACTEGTKASHHRDRCEGGVLGGAEYPESGGLVTTRYLVHPTTPTVLAEIRTLVTGQPAAAARIRLLPLPGRLPRLAVESPGVPARRFGHLDEDQTWEVPLRYDLAKGTERALPMVEALMDYADHAGIDAMNWQVLRYGDAQYDLPGRRQGGSHFVEQAGATALLLDRAAGRGMRVTLTVNLNALPEIAGRPDLAAARAADGWSRRSRSGQPVKAWNGLEQASPLHPDWRRRWLAHLDEVFARFAAHPACAGVELWAGEWVIDPEAAFDQRTTAAFAAASGIAGLPAGDGGAACAARADLLLGRHRQAWTDWCCAANAALVAEVVARLGAAAPGKALRVVLGGPAMKGSPDDPSAEGVDPLALLRDEGLDVGRLRTAGAVVVPMRQPTWDRWQLHWNRQRSTADELLADPVRQAALATPGVGASYGFYRYFESFFKSPLPSRYNSYFQDADAKPHGRFALREPVQALTAYDAQEILLGAQSLGTAGREAEMREFARAFRALPVGVYQDVPGARDPLCVRQAVVAGRTFLYAANRWHAPVRLELEVAGGVRDLGAGRDLAPADGRLALTLAPFQLVALRLSGPARVAGVAPDAAAAAAAQVRADAYAAGIAQLDGFKAPVGEHRARLAALQAALTAGAVAEAHRLWASKPVLGLEQELEQARSGFLGEAATQAARGRYALNCGATRYFRTPAGQLWRPDQRWRPGGCGFDGDHHGAEHDITRMTGPVDRFLLFSEAYGVRAYRFAVPAGSYTVRLFNRIGYQPNAAPGKVVMSLNIEGRQVWDRLDLFEALGRDDTKALVSEWKGIRCDDGVLDLEWSTPDGGGGWVNAIEVIPEDAKP